MAVGDEINHGEYPEYIITIDDKKGEAIMYSHYTGHYYLHSVNDKHEVLGRLGIVKRP